MTLLPEDLLRLLVAVIVGGLIGAEREFRDKSAGFRTIIFICVGATLFTMFSQKLGEAVHDPVRIAAQIVAGIGFLGAGAILRDGNRVTGLTTASTIWLSAALGMGIGGGNYALVGVALGAVLVVLWIFPHLEALIDRTREARTYEVVTSRQRDKLDAVDILFREAGLSLRAYKQLKRGERMTGVWTAYGSPQRHHRVVERLLDDPDVIEMSY